MDWNLIGLIVLVLVCVAVYLWLKARAVPTASPFDYTTYTRVTRGTKKDVAYQVTYMWQDHGKVDVDELPEEAEL